MLKENRRMLKSKKQSTSIRHEVSSKNCGQEFGATELWTGGRKGAQQNSGHEDSEILDRILVQDKKV